MGNDLTLMEKIENLEADVAELELQRKEAISRLGVDNIEEIKKEIEVISIKGRAIREQSSMLYTLEEMKELKDRTSL